MKLSWTFGSASFELFLSLHCKYTHLEATKMGTFSVNCGSFLDIICGPVSTWFLLHSHPGSLLSRYTCWPHCSVFRFVGLGWGPEFCVFKNSLGDSDGQFYRFGKHWLCVTYPGQWASQFIHSFTRFLSHSTHQYQLLLVWGPQLVLEN